MQIFIKFSSYLKIIFMPSNVIIYIAMHIQFVLYPVSKHYVAGTNHQLQLNLARTVHRNN